MNGFTTPVAAIASHGRLAAARSPEHVSFSQVRSSIIPAERPYRSASRLPSGRPISLLPHRKRGRPRLFSGTVGLIVLDEQNGSTPMPLGLMQGIVAAAEHAKLRLSIRFVNDIASAAEVDHFQLCDGLILVGHLPHTPRPAHWMQLPVVSVGSDHSPPAWGDSIAMDHGQIGIAAAQWLAERQCSNLIYFGPKDSYFKRTIEQSFRAEAIYSNRSAASFLYGDLAGDKRIALAVIENIQASPNARTGLFIEEYATIPHLIKAARQANLDIIPGSNVELITCSAQPASLTGMQPRPAVIEFDYKVLGCEAIDHLAYLIRSNWSHRRANITLLPHLTIDAGRV